jgi:hypothetical protein
MRLRLGRDTESVCPRCLCSVWTSEVVGWPEGVRCWWFLTGLCLECQLA